jgi:glycosyltransferase involved in cell wall biosynthesis
MFRFPYISQPRCRRFYDERYGGLERHVALLLRGLCREATTWNLVANDRFRAEVVPVDGYEVIKVPSLGLVASTPICPTMPFVARRVHRQHDLDVAHLHFPDPMSHFAASLLPHKVKLVISWHSDIVRQQTLLRLYGPFFAFVIKRADAIIAATPKHFESSTQLTLFKDRSKYHVVPYGVDYAPYLTSAAKNQGDALKVRHGGAPLIFTVGRHVYYKGFEYLIEAMHTVRPDARLLLGGQGPLSDALRKRLRESGLEDRIILTGRIRESELLVAPGSTILTDGWSGYSRLSECGYTHRKTVMSASEDPAHVGMPGVRRIASLLKRWILGTHQGSVSDEHLQSYLEEFTFRFNRRTSRSRGLVFRRLLEQAVATGPVTDAEVTYGYYW